MNFKKFAEEKFGIVFPKNTVFEEKREGIRAFAKTLMPIDIKGKRGILVYAGGPTNAFVRTFGKLATKNTVRLGEEEIKNLFQNKKLKNKINLAKNKHYIIFFKNQPAGVVFCDGSFLIPARERSLQTKNHRKIRKI